MESPLQKSESYKGRDLLDGYRRRHALALPFHPPEERDLPSANRAFQIFHLIQKRNSRTHTGTAISLAEKERFELSRRLNPTYTLSRGASSAS